MNGNANAHRSVEPAASRAYARQLVVDFLRTQGLVYNEGGENHVKHRHLEHLDSHYPDLKEALGDPSIRTVVADWAVDRIPKIVEDWVKRTGTVIDGGVTCVAGRGDGGIPLATAISDRAYLRGMDLRTIAIRYTERRHGPEINGHRLEIDGYLPTYKDIIIIVDDIQASGGSTKMMVDVLNHSVPTGRARIAGGIAIVKRCDGTVHPDIPITHLVRADELRYGKKAA